MKKLLQNFLKINIAILILCIVVGSSRTLTEADESGNAKIHFISLYGYSDAILLESNGHFGLVDSGEDWDYPNSLQYPLRSGVATSIGYDQQVIHYLKDVCGVKKLDFYLATHSHSDHIGTGDEILNDFPVDRLYINRYDDSYISSKDRLWDNQYVYDCIVNKAKEKSVQIITDLDLEENRAYRSFTMGEMKISIMNYERDRDAGGNIIPTADENDNALTVLVQAYGKNAFLTSDIGPRDGDTAKLANQLVDKLWDTAGVDKDKTEKPGDSENTENNEKNGTSENTGENQDKNTDGSGDDETKDNIKIDESVANTGKRVQLDLLKLPHHGLKESYSKYFLTSLNPKNVVVTGPSYNFDSDMQRDLPNVKLYSTFGNSAAVVADLGADTTTVSFKQANPGYYTIDGRQYYFDNCARLCSWNQLSNDGKWYFFEKGNKAYGWKNVGGVYYYLDKDGVMQIGWKFINGNWYYLGTNGVMTTGWQFINDSWYYMNANGVMQTGWQLVNGSWYYMNGGGTMAIGWQYIDGSWYYLAGSGAMVTGWQYLNGNWYYMNGSGAMITGWQLVGGSWYYMNSGGAMTTGWQYLNGNWYYMNGSGAMTTGWQFINGYWYYMNAGGAMDTGWQFINGYWYYLDGSGAMATGWRMVNGIWYFMNSSGAWMY